MDYVESRYRDGAWQEFQGHAQYHPSLTDLGEFNEIKQKLIDHESFHIARYNDGEWAFMLRIPPYWDKWMRENGHIEDEVIPITAKMLDIIHSDPPYYIGVDSTTRAMKGAMINAGEVLTPYIERIPNLVYGDLFNAATIMHGPDILLDAFKDRVVISVGPAHFKKLDFSRHHISVPSNNCWRVMDQVEDVIDRYIQSYIHRHPVVVYSCSFLAKILVDVFFHRYGEQTTQVDVGSCLDPWCGVQSRFWHRKIIKYINRRDFDPKSTYNGQGYTGWGYPNEVVFDTGYTDLRYNPILQDLD